MPGPHTLALPPPPSPPQPAPSAPAPASRPSSTFRRVPLRPAQSPSAFSHRLSPSPIHSRAPSVASASSAPTPRVSSPLPAPPSDLPSSTAQRKQKPPTDLAIRTAQIHSTQSVNFDGSATPSKSVFATSTDSRPTTPNHRTLAPYRPGFQPRGVYRPLTDDFVSHRCLHHDGGRPSMTKRVERTKLERRLEKLISLHFPKSSLEMAPVAQTIEEKAVNGQTMSNIRRFSSSFDLDSIKNMDAGSLWKNMVSGKARDGIREAEQRITPWQDDSVVNRCPLCSAYFHPLTNRKHHCRLCGQIICALPQKRSHRPVTCSYLFVVDPHSSAIEEVSEGVDYGVRRKRRISSDGNSNAIAAQDNDNDKFLKGVRICRTCRPVLLRRKYRQEASLIPSFVRLHNELIDLEREIEAALPQFQELVLGLSHNDPPTKEASAVRKRLLEAFAQYDALSKRIYQLPCINGPGSSQYRVQSAVLARTNIFLQKNMFPLKSLSTTDTSTPRKSDAENVTGPHSVDLELAQRLQPLLEQEALLETFVEEAEARRKFEDLKTLKSNLDEIRAEIQRIAESISLKPPLRERG
ncbi:hypothetical protein AX15_003964 [Amanita polypyramis BW_CC]|nr:hypothetical protein AX15_003964 [Amanita polypyramis BW_CC]